MVVLSPPGTHDNKYWIAMLNSTGRVLLACTMAASSVHGARNWIGAQPCSEERTAFAHGSWSLLRQLVESWVLAAPPYWKVGVGCRVQGLRIVTGTLCGAEHARAGHVAAGAVARAREIANGVFPSSYSTHIFTL